MWTSLFPTLRNKDRLQAYQREYARERRAPGRRKVSRMQRQLLEADHSRKCRLLKREGLRTSSKAAFPPCVSLPPFLLSSSYAATRAYRCTLIVRSRAADPRRNPFMIEEEEEAQEHFQAIKDSFQMVFPCGWKNKFKNYVDNFIGGHLKEARRLVALPCVDDSEEEGRRIFLHHIRRLVAGAVQEWELAQQPEYATECAKIDGALVWSGRGYVVPIRLLFLYINHLHRVHLKAFYKCYGW
jgi:hypothetical protein